MPTILLGRCLQLWPCSRTASIGHASGPHYLSNSSRSVLPSLAAEVVPVVACKKRHAPAVRSQVRALCSFRLLALLMKEWDRMAYLICTPFWRLLHEAPQSFILLEKAPQDVLWPCQLLPSCQPQLPPGTSSNRNPFIQEREPQVLGDTLAPV